MWKLLRLEKPVSWQQCNGGGGGGACCIATCSVGLGLHVQLTVAGMPAGRAERLPENMAWHDIAWHGIAWHHTI
eukprot:355136-Chlamydomonas_euryale.AAC.3